MTRALICGPRTSMLVVIAAVIATTAGLAQKAPDPVDPGDQARSVIAAATTVRAIRIDPRQAEDHADRGWCGTSDGPRRPPVDRTMSSAFTHDLDANQRETVRSLMLERWYDHPYDSPSPSLGVFRLSFPGEPQDIDVSFDNTCQSLRIRAGTGWTLDLQATYSVREEWLDFFNEVFRADLER
jgi:hypothetical protein